MQSKKEIGKMGEDIAVKYLSNNGFEVLELNFTVWGGEIDIIALKSNVFHIIEVKTSKSHIKPEDHINKKKMQKVAKTAEYYINYKQNRIKKSDRNCEDLSFRLDVILIQINAYNQVLSLKYLPDFEL